jgi:hypothetical protein
MSALPPIATAKAEADIGEVTSVSTIRPEGRFSARQAAPLWQMASAECRRHAAPVRQHWVREELDAALSVGAA